MFRSASLSGSIIQDDERYSYTKLLTLPISTALPTPRQSVHAFVVAVRIKRKTFTRATG